MSLAERFLDQVDPSLRAALSAIEDLDALVRHLVAAAREARPRLALDEDAFAAYLGARISADWATRDRLTSVCAGDLLLAQHCAAGDPLAIEILHAQLFPRLDAAIGRINRSSDFIDDIKSSLRELLLVSRDGAPPKIAEYSGRGELGAFLQVSAVRLALRSAQKQAREVPTEDAALADLQAAVDPELASLKESYRGEFKSAFVEAWRALTSIERNLLRNHYLDGMTTEGVADLHSIHRATAVRWIAKARDRLFAATRAIVAERLKLERDELDSMMRLVQSQLSLSLPQFLTKI